MKSLFVKKLILSKYYWYIMFFIFHILSYNEKRRFNFKIINNHLYDEQILITTIRTPLHIVIVLCHLILVVSWTVDHNDDKNIKCKHIASS